MKRTLIIVLGLLAATWLPAQYHVLELGGSLGTEAWLAGKDIQSHPGFTGAIDANYLYLAHTRSGVFIGPKLGVQLRYGGSMLSRTPYKEQYTNVDYYVEDMDYTITASRYEERSRALMLQVPLMLAIHTNGWTIGVGAKGMMQLTGQRALKVFDPWVVAYYPDFEVPVNNELVTGKIIDQGARSGKGILPRWNVCVSAELGYEWELDYNGAVGVQLYADYGVWNNYTNNPPRERLIDVEPILNTEYPVPPIHVNYVSDTYAQRLNYLSVGLRVYYAISKKSKPCYPCHWVE